MVKLTNSVRFCIARDINYIGKVCLLGFTTILFEVTLYHDSMRYPIFPPCGKAKYGYFVETMNETDRIQHVLREKKNDNIFLLNNNFMKGYCFCLNSKLLVNKDVKNECFINVQNVLQTFPYKSVFNVFFFSLVFTNVSFSPIYQKLDCEVHFTN